MRLSKFAPVIFIAILGILLFVIRNFEPEKTTSKGGDKNDQRNLNRHPDKIVYSKHARCRMNCRDITETEVKEVLEGGKINYKKCRLQKAHCESRYAVEDEVNNQYIRIIVAPCNEQLTVVTCIDMEHEWNCDCK